MGSECWSSVAGGKIDKRCTYYSSWTDTTNTSYLTPKSGRDDTAHTHLPTVGYGSIGALVAENAPYNT